VLLAAGTSDLLVPFALFFPLRLRRSLRSFVTLIKPWCLCMVKHRSSRLEEQLVDVAPGPVLTRLEGLDNRVVGGVEMPGGVLILRIVTAADVSTGETEAQVHPAISNFQTVLTSIGARRDLAYLVEVATLFCHLFRFSFLDTPGCSCLFS